MTVLNPASFEGETLKCRQEYSQTPNVDNSLDSRPGNAKGSSKPEPESLDLPDLITHICETHHAYLNEAMPRILWLARKAAKTHSQDHVNLVDLLEVFSAHSEALAMHLRMEEEILFPAILERVAKKAPLLAKGSAIRATLRNWILDHEVEGDGLERLRELAHGYAIPSWAGPEYVELMNALRHFDEDMQLHMRLETEVLFPRAIAAARAEA